MRGERAECPEVIGLKPNTTLFVQKNIEKINYRRRNSPILGPVLRAGIWYSICGGVKARSAPDLFSGLKYDPFYVRF